MRVKSALTQRVQPYRAGMELAAELSEIKPELVLVFTSIHYAADFATLHAGLMDGLPGAKPLVVGCTGDGVYESDRLANHGISALAVNSEGAVRWQAALRRGIFGDVASVAESCARAAGGTDASFALVFAEGTKGNGGAVLDGMKRVLACPFAGGMAGDDRRLEHSWVYLNGEAAEEAMVALTAHGDFRFALHTASGWNPVGDEGVVESSTANVVERIGGMSAMEFYREQIGAVPGEMDIGLIPLAEYPSGCDGNPILHTIVNMNAMTGDITVLGAIPRGTFVRVCQATREDVLNGVDGAMAGVQQAGIEPAGMLMVSCAGRRWILGERWREEVSRIHALLGTTIPLAGFPSFGEVGPFRKTADGLYTPSYLHSNSCVLWMIGK